MMMKFSSVSAWLNRRVCPQFAPNGDLSKCRGAEAHYKPFWGKEACNYPRNNGVMVSRLTMLCLSGGSLAHVFMLEPLWSPQAGPLQAGSICSNWNQTENIVPGFPSTSSVDMLFNGIILRLTRSSRRVCWFQQWCWLMVSRTARLAAAWMTKIWASWFSEVILDLTGLKFDFWPGLKRLFE